MVEVVMSCIIGSIEPFIPRDFGLLCAVDVSRSSISSVHCTSLSQLVSCSSYATA